MFGPSLGAHCDSPFYVVLLVAVVQELLRSLLREQRARVVRLDVVVQVELLHHALRHLAVDAAVGALEPISAAPRLLDAMLDDDLPRTAHRGHSARCV